MAVFYIRTTTEEVDRLPMLHQIEDLLQNLVMGVQRVHLDKENLVIVKAIVSLAGNLKLCPDCSKRPTSSSACGN
ncbi:MAG: hypothetical protein ACM3MB_00310 [Acidobacteriota bacterium]